jgi:beta-glucosidase
MTIPPYLQPDLPLEQRLEDLLERMSLEEKVAQVTTLDLGDAVLDPQGNLPETALEKLKLGAGVIPRPALYLSPEEGANFTNAIQRALVETTRLGIPALFHEEVLHGLMAFQATSFPQAIALGSAWDPDLVQSVYQAASLEMRSRGSNLALTPDLDLGREPRWGRIEETFGEDPCLVSRMAVAAVRGLQGEGPDRFDQEHVMATAKHFAAHGQPEGGRNCAPANFSERILREQFLPPFEAAVKEAGVGAIMASYNEINGIPAHVNPWLLKQVLRDEWGFDGMLISDGDGINHLHVVHRVAESPAEAARLALANGIALELPHVACYVTLVDQVRSERVAETLLDEAVRQTLLAKFRLGLFERPYVDPQRAGTVNNSSQHRDLALEAARKSIVLLKNEAGLLPLDRAKISKLAVIGPNAGGLHLGGYSYDPGRGVSLLEGIRSLAGEGLEVLYAEGCRITEEHQDWRGWWNDDIPPGDPEKDKSRIAQAVEAARQADVVVLAIGENEATCREAWSEPHLGDRDSLDLLGSQQALFDAVYETGKPVVVALIGGRPLSINEIAQKAPAILECWYLGQEGGTAFAEVLFGDANPGGKLPVTFPRSVGQLPAYYYHKPSTNRSYLYAENGPLFPFGHGLSYTSFSFDNLRLSKERITPDESFLVSIDVTNIGERAGDEVVQVYIRDLYTSVTRPVMELKRFRRIGLLPGERQTVEFTLQPADLSFLGPDMERIVEPGEFEVLVGPDLVNLQKVGLMVES